MLYKGIYVYIVGVGIPSTQLHLEPIGHAKPNREYMYFRLNHRDQAAEMKFPENTWPTAIAFSTSISTISMVCPGNEMTPNRNLNFRGAHQ